MKSEIVVKEEDEEKEQKEDKIFTPTKLKKKVRLTNNFNCLYFAKLF